MLAPELALCDLAALEAAPQQLALVSGGAAALDLDGQGVGLTRFRGRRHRCHRLGQGALGRLAPLERLLVGRPGLLRRLQAACQLGCLRRRGLGGLGNALLLRGQALDCLFRPRQLVGSMMLHLLESRPEGLAAQRAVGFIGQCARPFDLLVGPNELVRRRLELTLDGAEITTDPVGSGAGRLARLLVGSGRFAGQHDLGKRRLSLGDGLQGRQALFGARQALGLRLQLRQRRGRLGEAPELDVELGDALLGGGVLVSHRLALGDDALVFASRHLQLLVGLARRLQRLLGVDCRLDHHLLGVAGRRGRRLGFGHLGLQRLELGQQAAGLLVLLGGLAPVLAGLVAGGVDGVDAQELQNELLALGRRLGAEGGQLLLLGEHRCPEGGVVHAQDRAHVSGGVAHALGHLEAVGVGLGLHRRADPRDRAPHDVEVALVLELDLGHAVGVDARGADLLVRRAAPAVKHPPDALDKTRLPGPVAAVDADEAGRQLDVELFVHPVVAQPEFRQPHFSSAPSTARARYSWPRVRMRSRSKPMRSVPGASR